MKTRSSKQKIIVLIDPYSSGIYLKEAVAGLEYSLITVNTLTAEQVLQSGKSMDSRVKSLQEFYATDVDTAHELLSPFQQDIVAVIAASEPGVELADGLAARLGLRGNSPETTQYRRNKHAMRQALKGTRFVANNLLCKSVDDVLRFADSNPYPLVVKALNSAGNDHVYFCHHEEELLDSVGHCLGGTTIFGEPIDEVLVEEFIHGDLYAVECFVQQQEILITAIWRVDMVDIPETNGRIFTGFALENDPEIHRQIRGALSEIVPKVGLEIGPGLIEFKYHAATKDLKLIELASRLSGIDLPKIQKEISDFDPLEATINCFVSNEFQLPEKVHIHKIAEIYFKSVPRGGHLRQIRGLPEIKQLPSCFQAKVFCKPDHAVAVTRDQATLAAAFYLVHRSQEQIDQDKKKIDELFVLEIC